MGWTVPSRATEIRHDVRLGNGLGRRHVLCPLFMIALLVLAVVLIVALVRWFSGAGEMPRDGSRTARQILDERFAKGEIDREDYDARRKALGL